MGALLGPAGPTTAGDVWFKTSIASPLFVNEGVVMWTLVRLFPGRVPAPLAVDAERGWMVLAGFGARVGWDASLEAVEEELRARLRAAYLPAWSSFEAPGRLARAWVLATPLGVLHQAISYRSLVASLQPPIDLHMSQSTAWWLRQVLAQLP